MKESEVKAGWSRRDITPPLPVGLCGQFHVRVATTILDPLTLTALALSTDEDAVIWVSCDLVDLPSDFHGYCRERLTARLPDFDVSKLVISATHTHTAPYLSPLWHAGAFPPGVPEPRAYFEQAAEALVSAAVEAWQNRAPARVSYGHGYAVCAHQRRMTYFHDLPEPHRIGQTHQTNAAMYGKTATPEFKGFEGYVDHRVDFIFTSDPSGQPTGAIVALPCPAQATEWLSEVSADFWHEVRQNLKAEFANDFHLLPLCCAAGDLAPRQQLQKAGEERMLKWSALSNRQAIANRITAALKETLHWCQNDQKENLVLSHHTKDLNLSRRTISEPEYLQLKEGLPELLASKGTDPAAESTRIAKVYRVEQALRRYKEQQQTCSVEHHVIRLGDIAFCTFPMEVYLNYALRIQAQSPALATMLIQLTGSGPKPNGYLPTAEADAGGGYSACIYCSPISPEGGQQMVNASTSIIMNCFPDAQSC